MTLSTCCIRSRYYTFDDCSHAIPSAAQYGLPCSLGLFSWTLSRFIPIWNPFMAWIAAWELCWLSKLTKPAIDDKKQRKYNIIIYSCKWTCKNTYIHCKILAYKHVAEILLWSHNDHYNNLPVAWWLTGLVSTITSDVGVTDHTYHRINCGVLCDSPKHLLWFVALST